MDFGKRLEDIKLEDIETSGTYSSELLENIRWRKFDQLLKLPLETRRDRDFMEPLFFAVRNSLNTYAIYIYSETLQKDEQKTAEVIEKEPQIIEGTSLSSDKEFIINNVKYSADLVHYMDPSLKNSDIMIIALCELGNPKVTAEILKSNDMSIDRALKFARQNGQSTMLASNTELFKIGIQLKGAGFLENASSELRNNFEFLREISSKNRDVVRYAALNKAIFGLEGIKAVVESSKEVTFDENMKQIEEIIENGKDDKYQRFARIKNAIEEKGENNPAKIRWLTAMAVQKDEISLETLQNALDYTTLALEKINKDVDEDGKSVVSLENVQTLVTPNILNKMKDKLEKQGINLDEVTQKQLNEYSEAYNKYYEEFKKQKESRREITLHEVKDVTEEVKLSDAQKQCDALVLDVKKPEDKNVPLNLNHEEVGE